MYRFVPLIVVLFLMQTAPSYATSAEQPNSSSQGASCARIWNRISTFGSKRNKFDVEKFRIYKLLYKDLLAQPDVAPAQGPKSIEATLALLEATAEHNGTDILQINQLLEQGPDRDMKKVIKRLRKLNAKNGIAEIHARELIEDLYLIINGNSFKKTGKLPLWLQNKDPKTVRAKIRQHIETELLSNDLISALKSLGIARDKSLLESLKLWHQANKNLFEAITNIAFNAFTVQSFGFPTALPKFNFTKTKTVPPEILALVREKGFNAAYDDVAKLFGKRADFDLRWRTAQIIYNRLLSPYMILMMTPVVPLIKNILALSHRSDDDVRKLQERTFNSDKIRKEQFESWKEAFKEFNGRYPDSVAHPEDKEEWDREWKHLQTTSDEDLKAKIRKQSPH